MEQTANGIVVEPGSTITITTLARNLALNLTAFAPSAEWTTLSSPIVVVPLGLVSTGTFQAPKAPDRCNIVVEFDFDLVPDAGGDFPAGADYVVTITEKTRAGQSTTIDDPPPVTPPPSVDRPYKFITR